MVAQPQKGLTQACSLHSQVASEDTGIEQTVHEVQRRCVLLVARDMASHVRIPLEQYGWLNQRCRKMIQGTMHHIWCPAVRMVCGEHMQYHALGVDIRGKQLLDVCLAVLAGNVSVAHSMPQAHTSTNMLQLRAELGLLEQLAYQSTGLDCKI